MTARTLLAVPGFEIVGTLPFAFEHPKHGIAEAFVMFQALQTASDLAPTATSAVAVHKARRTELSASTMHRQRVLSNDKVFDGR